MKELPALVFSMEDTILFPAKNVPLNLDVFGSMKVTDGTFILTSAIKQKLKT